MGLILQYNILVTTNIANNFVHIQFFSTFAVHLEKGGVKAMIIVPIKEGENIERALKKFKRKFEKTGAVREMRSRKNFEKPSVKKRMALQKAIYVQQLRLREEQ